METPSVPQVELGRLKLPPQILPKVELPANEGWGFKIERTQKRVNWAKTIDSHQSETVHSSHSHWWKGPEASANAAFRLQKESVLFADEGCYNHSWTAAMIWHDDKNQILFKNTSEM